MITDNGITETTLLIAFHAHSGSVASYKWTFSNFSAFLILCGQWISGIIDSGTPVENLSHFIVLCVGVMAHGLGYYLHDTVGK